MFSYKFFYQIRRELITIVAKSTGLHIADSDAAQHWPMLLGKTELK